MAKKAKSTNPEGPCENTAEIMCGEQKRAKPLIVGELGPTGVGAVRRVGGTAYVSLGKRCEKIAIDPAKPLRVMVVQD